MGKNRKRNQKKSQQNAKATLDAMGGVEKVAQNLIPAKGPSDGTIKYDKDLDEVTIRNPDGTETVIRPEKAIEADEMAVDESDFEVAFKRVRVKRLEEITNPMRDLKALTIKESNDVDVAVGRTWAIMAPNFWRKVGAQSWRCNLMSFVECDLFSDIVVRCIGASTLTHKAKVVLAINGTALLETKISSEEPAEFMKYPKAVPKFALHSCCLEIVVDNVEDSSTLCGLTFEISSDTYMLGDAYRKLWMNRLTAQIYFESNYEGVKRQYVLPISNGSAQRILVASRESYKKIQAEEDAKRQEQLELLKKAREQDRPNFKPQLN